MKFRGQANMVVPLIGLVVFVLIAMTLAPIVGDSTGGLLNGTAAGLGQNMTAGGRAMIPLIPLMYIVIIIVSILGFMSFKSE